MAEVISVSALNQYVKTLLDANDLLFDLALRGEIANFVQNARSGHCYFSLRDETSSVKAVMFRSDARRLGFRPEEGMKVIVRCRATLYERDGAFQVYVNDMFPDGIGSAQLAFEQLKAKLDREGLFSAERKSRCPGSRSALASSPARRGPRCRISGTSSGGGGPPCGCCSARSVCRDLKRLTRSPQPSTGWTSPVRWTRSSWRAAAEAGKTSGSSMLSASRGPHPAAKHHSSAPSATRSTLRSWTLWQTSVPRPHRRRQSLPCPTGPNFHENYAIWKKIFTFLSKTG